MSESTLAVTAGSGTLLHTFTSTIGANTVHAQFTMPDEYPYASYSVFANGISGATLNSHIIELMAGPSLNVRIRRIYIEQSANAGAVALFGINVLRLTTAGTGGTAITPGKYDTADSAAGATAMTLPSAGGTESTVLLVGNVAARAAVGGGSEDSWEWEQQPNTKPLIIPAGTSNGIAIKNVNAIATATWLVTIEFAEMNH